MAKLDYTVTDLPPVWPGQKTTDRKPARFKTQWTRTIELLARELEWLGARRVEIAVAARFGDFNQSGGLRADARPGPPVILSFLDADGQRQAYPCDTFAWWQDNLYAIAIVLEDLRRAERYGVQSALLRAGFKALPAAGATIPTLSAKQAAYAIARLAEDPSPDGASAAILETRSAAAHVLKIAKSKAHPDVGGKNEDWTLLQEAERIIKAHHGGSL